MTTAIHARVERHARVVPRYQDEPLPQRTAHPWACDWTQAGAFDARSLKVLRVQICSALGVS